MGQHVKANYPTIANDACNAEASKTKQPWANAIAAMVLSAVFSQSLYASAETTYEFNIASQPLAGALLELATQAEKQIFFRSAWATDLKSPPISGSLTLDSALKIALQDSDLKAAFTENQQIRITRARGYFNSDIEPETGFESSDVMELYVTGFRQSWQTSSQLKKESIEIKDVVSELDMDKLPDGNIADSLQRLPGVQIERRNGDGTRVRVRGFDDNITLFNGDLFLSGMEHFQLGLEEQTYENSIENVPIELLRRMEIRKSSRASDIEGAMGGTVNLVSRSAFDIEDYLATADLKLDYGKFAQKAQPEIFFGLGKNWNNELAILATLNFEQRTMHMDLLENYRSRQPTGNRLSGIVSTFDDGSESFNYLRPLYTSLSDIEQTRTQRGASLNLAWQPNNHWELQAEWFGIYSDLEQRNYDWLNAVEGFLGDTFEFNKSEAIPYLTSLDYSSGDQTYRTIGEKFKTNADNLSVSLRYTPDTNWEMTTKLNASFADFDQALGNADLVTAAQTLFLPVWIGEDPVTLPDETVLFSPSGWTTLFNICEFCQDSANFTYPLRYDIRSNNFTDYSAPVTQINRPEETYGAFNQAKASATEEKAWSIRNDIKFFLDEDSGYIQVGFRASGHETEFSQYRYLTDLSRTVGAAQPNVYDEDGNIVTASSFSPSDPASDNNVGIALPTFYDLCNNGGLFTGNPCDINGDSLDDNVPYGPWVYQVDPINQASIFNFSDIFAFADLYGQFFGLDVPGFVPWRSYSQFPNDYVTLNDFYPTGSLQTHTASFVNGETISRDVFNWIDSVTPNSPTDRFLVPKNTWTVDQKTTALYFEYNKALEAWPVSYNIGLRFVETDLSIERSVVASEQGVSLTNEPWYISGVGQGWTKETINQRYHAYLPSATVTWDLSDQWKLRASASRNISRPSFHDLGRGDEPNYQLEFDFDTFSEFQQAKALRTGNPNLNPARIKQGDLSIEYYHDESSYLQVAMFYKHIQNDISESVQTGFVRDESPNGQSLAPITMPANRANTAYVRGLETSLQKVWRTGFGFSINASFLDADSDDSTLTHDRLGLAGVSDKTLNTSAFYENDRFRFLLSYAWRDEYVAPYNGIVSATSFFNEEGFVRMANIVKAYGQWDAKFLYFFGDRISASIDLINLTESEQTSYLEFASNTRSRTVWEPRIIAGLKIDF